MLKNKVSCKDEKVNLDHDTCNFLRIKLLKLSNFEVLPFIYPRIYALHDLLEDKTLGEYENDVMKMPQVK